MSPDTIPQIFTGLIALVTSLGALYVTISNARTIKENKLEAVADRDLKNVKLLNIQGAVDGNLSKISTRLDAALEEIKFLRTYITDKVKPNGAHIDAGPPVTPVLSIDRLK